MWGVGVGVGCGGEVGVAVGVAAGGPWEWGYGSGGWGGGKDPRIEPGTACYMGPCENNTSKVLCNTIEFIRCLAL